MSNARSRQLAYFKDNIQTQDDHDDFDASQYYYNRDDQMTPTTGSSPGVLLGGATKATHSEPGSASALYRSGQPHFNSPVHGMNGAPYNNTPSGIGNLQQQVAPLTSSFATNHPSRSLPVPQMGHSSSTPYAPSSDLLAMLSKGVPINSATEVSGVESRYADDTTVNSSRIGLVGAAAPSHGRGGPFKMSDFPALDGIGAHLPSLLTAQLEMRNCRWIRRRIFLVCSVVIASCARSPYTNREAHFSLSK